MAGQVGGRIGGFARHRQRIEWGFFAFFLALLSYSVLDALAVLPDEQGFQPQRMVALSGALFIQSMAALLQTKVSWVSFALAALSIGVLIGSLSIAR